MSEADQPPSAGESCVQPAGGPVAAGSSGGGSPAGGPAPLLGKESVQMMARVGQPAPDFEATAYVDGGFQTVKLSDYQGQWVVLCFYPGDFTFV